MAGAEVKSGGGAGGTGISLDAVTKLIRDEVVGPVSAKVLAQQDKLRALAPDADHTMHHVTEGFVGSAVRSAVDQGSLISQVIELVVAELLKAFNKPKPATGPH